jgi:hypothetical protein
MAPKENAREETLRRGFIGVSSEMTPIGVSCPRHCPALRIFHLWMCIGHGVSQTVPSMSPRFHYQKICSLVVFGVCAR